MELWGFCEMKLVLTLMAAIGSMMVVTATASTAFAASPSSSPTGNDVSYPQCGKTLPSSQAFGIVGVNDGLANNTNPCLATEIAWAQKSSGGTSQPRASLYVNTADPGNLGVADWPNSNTDPVTKNDDTNLDPWGQCTGGDDQACAWQYGWNMAVLDAQIRVVSNPGGYKWWLDVETGNSWESGATGLQNNDADLEGMVAYFQSIGSTVGIYSTGNQWGQIAGTVSSGSSLYALTNWIPGARTLSQAKSKCSSTPLTGGGKVTATQWTSSIDGDYSCA
jgi:hypothetical protein